MVMNNLQRHTWCYFCFDKVVSKIAARYQNKFTQDKISVATFFFNQKKRHLGQHKDALEDLKTGKQQLLERFLTPVHDHPKSKHVPVAKEMAHHHSHRQHHHHSNHSHHHHPHHHHHKDSHWDQDQESHQWVSPHVFWKKHQTDSTSSFNT